MKLPLYQLDAFTRSIMRHTMLNESLLRMFGGFQHDAHPMAMVSAIVASMAAFYHDTAPEQLLGEKVDARADLYAFGVVLFEMATGRRPFQGPVPTALAQQICYQAPPMPSEFNPRVPRRVDEIILKCLEKDDKRYQSALEVKVDLGRSNDTTATIPREQGTKGGSKARTLVRRAGAVAAGAVASCWRLLLLPYGGRTS